MRTPDYKTSVVLVMAAGVAWSMMGLGLRLLEEARTWQVLLYRSLALALVLLAVIAVRSGGRPFRQIRRTWVPTLIGAIGLVMAYAGGIYSIQSTTVANAVFLFAAAPFFTAILARILLAEPVRPATWIALAVASVGVAIMVREGLAAGALAGNAAAVGSALGFAIFTISLRWGKLDDMLPAVFVSAVLAIFVSVTMCLALGWSLVLPAWDVGVTILMGVFQLGLGLTLYTIGSKVVPAAELTLLSMTEVLLGPFWVWAFLGETASKWTLAGGFILLAAIAGNALSGIRHRPPAIM
jgi:drug/metabolite transporter, DME family